MVNRFYGRVSWFYSNAKYFTHGMRDVFYYYLIYFSPQRKPMSARTQRSLVHSRKSMTSRKVCFVHSHFFLYHFMDFITSFTVHCFSCIMLCLLYIASLTAHFFPVSFYAYYTMDLYSVFHMKVCGIFVWPLMSN